MSLALCLMFVLAAGLLPGRAAEAADLGDDCCADLETRIAEFDAATVRRFGKVSVTLTGYVTKQVMSWDDGIERDAYIADIGPTQASNFRVSGQATIAPRWTAGYMLRVQNCRTARWVSARPSATRIWASTCRCRTGSWRVRITASSPWAGRL